MPPGADVILWSVEFISIYLYPAFPHFAQGSFTNHILKHTKQNKMLNILHPTLKRHLQAIAPGRQTGFVGAPENSWTVP